MRAWAVVVLVGLWCPACDRALSSFPVPAIGGSGVIGGSGGRGQSPTSSAMPPAVMMSTLSAMPAVTTATSSVMPPVVQSGVAERVAAEGRARVIVHLRDPVLLRAPLSERRQAVALAQQALLEAVPPRSFLLRHRYGVVPAVAGEVDAVGLAALASAPGVESIQLDLPTRAALTGSVPALRADTAHGLGVTGAGVTVQTPVWSEAI